MKNHMGFKGFNRFKICLAVVGLGLLLGCNSVQATYRASTQELMSRQYPIYMGNQFHTSAINPSVVQKVASDLDIVSINKQEDLFVDHGANADIANQIHGLNPKVKVLQYLNLMDVWNTSDAYVWMKSNNAFLFDDNGREVHPYESTYGTSRWAGDPTNTGWQDYYANHSKSIVDQGMDGIFSDNWFRTNAQNWVLSPARFSAIVAGWETIGQKTKSLIGNKILIGNSPALNTYQSRDGSMVEMRNAPYASAFNYYLKLSDESASYGQINVDSIQNKFDGSEYMKSYDSILGFSLPACLLTDNIFAFSNDMKVFALVEKVGKIGVPKGPRYRINGVWERDFTAGKVVFNDTAAPITVPLDAGLYKDLNQTPVNSVTLDSFRGTILKNMPAPVSPSQLTVTGVAKGATSGNYFVNMAWLDNSVDETAFEVYQSVNPIDNFQFVGTVPSNTNSFSVNMGQIPAPGTYYYKVSAVSNAGKSDLSNTASVLLNPAPYAPSNLAVAGLTQGATSGNYYVNLTWNDTSSNETSFEVYQSVNSPDNFQLVSTVAANTGNFAVNVGATPVAGTYYYKVLAVNDSGKSAPTNIANANVNPIPTAPSDALVTSVVKGTSGNYFVYLQWKDNSANEKSFEIYQSLDPTANFKLIKTPVANSTTYGINIGSNPVRATYYYQVVAVNDYGRSPQSNTASAVVK